MHYENLLTEAYRHNIDTHEKPMTPRIKGLYADNIIWINKFIPTSMEKACILAEELGHYHTSSGDILDQTNLVNLKQEKRARNWAYKKLVPLNSLIDAHKAGVRNRFELADYLGITELFLEEVIKMYQEELGLYTNIKGYTIYFSPLGILKKFE